MHLCHVWILLFLVTCFIISLELYLIVGEFLMKHRIELSYNIKKQKKS